MPLLSKFSIHFQNQSKSLQQGYTQPGPCHLSASSPTALFTCLQTRSHIVVLVLASLSASSKYLHGRQGLPPHFLISSNVALSLSPPLITQYKIATVPTQHKIILIFSIAITTTRQTIYSNLSRSQNKLHEGWDFII